MKKKTVMVGGLLSVLSLLFSACATGIAQEKYDAVVAERDAAQAEITALETTTLGALLVATAKYQDVNVALADGYVSTERCIQAPPGGMGIHYVNFGLLEAPLDPLKPPTLLYLPSNGGVKLIGVEYFAPALASTATGPAPWFEHEAADSWVNTAPSVLGQTFAGPMMGHGPEDPWHYDLHVWLWADNPSGVFADFNPTLKCPPAP